METAMLNITFGVKDSPSAGRKQVEISPRCTAPVPVGRGLSNAKNFTTIVREGDPAAGSFSSRPINKIVRSRRGILSDDFVEMCHQKELLANKLQHPTRLIDLGADDEEISPKLALVEPGWNGRYATLSYCWGGVQQVCTTLSNLTIFQHEIPYSELPKSLQDACFVTRMFRLRYLWIDALCIIQDSKEDMARELPKMRDIYGGSAVTILASRARNVHQGFLHDRTIHYGQAFELPYLSPDNTQPGSIILCRQSSGEPIMPTEPLRTRAWALQELLLSPRSVEFGNLQTTWYCSTMKHIDGGWEHHDFGRPNLAKLNTYMVESTQSLEKRIEQSSLVDVARKTQVWAVLVNEYTSRNLTMRSDKLPAISGLAEAYESWLCLAQPLKYLAGLWHHHLPEGLLWSLIVPPASSATNCLQRQPSVMPSWSWASIEGQITMPYTPNMGCQSFSTTVVKVKVELLAADNRFGRVNSGCLVLKGPMFKARCSPSDPHGPLTTRDLGTTDGSLGWLPRQYTRFGSVTLDAREDAESREIDVWCLEISIRPCTGLWMHLIDRRLNDLGVKEGLVLIGTDEPNTFRRIGIYSADLRARMGGDWDEYMAWFKTWEEREIKLI